MRLFCQSNLLLIISLFLSLSASSQDLHSETNPFPMVKVDHSITSWYLEMQSEHPNVINAEASFIAYFNEKPKETSHQKRTFIRWMETAKLSMDSEGYYLPYTVASDEAYASFGMEKTLGSWRMLGPNFAEETTCGTSSSLSGGFCDRVYINPFNTDNLFAGFSYGGLWVSKDQGETWNLTDVGFGNGTNTYANRDYYYGEIEANELNDSLIFAATESGLLKSINGGTSWSMCAELNRSADASKRPYYIALSGADTDVVLSTFGRKVYRSADGGDSWAEAFDNTAGGSDHYFGGVHSVNSEFGLYHRNFNFFGLERDMDDPTIFYLGVWNAANDPCIYKSIDAGASFSFLVNLNDDLGRSLPENLSLQTIIDNPDQLYIYSHFTSDTLYRYTESGDLNSKTGITSMEAIRVNVLDEESVYKGYYGASSVNKSVDGGVSFTDMTSGYGGCPKYVHPDIRYIDAVGDLILIGSDGGLALSTNAMETVETIGREISAVDLWGFSSSPKSDILSAGCDHGPTKIRRYEGDNGWISRGGGDASRTSVNQSHDHLIYYNHGYGKFKTKLNADGTFAYTESISTAMRLETMEFHPNIFQTFYGHNGSKVYISRDNFVSETEFHDFGATVNEFKISPQDSSRMYVLHGNNTVERSTDAGLTWTNITPSVAITEGVTNIVGLTVGNDPDDIWLAYGNYQNEAKVIYSSVGGLFWTNITTPALPLTPVSEITHQMGTDGGIYVAFAGTAGIWYKSNEMPDWIEVGTGLASRGYVRGVFAVPPEGTFRMGSSRGSWEHDLIEESTDPIANFAASATRVYCPDTPIEFVQNSVHSSGEASYLWAFPGGYPSESTAELPVVHYATPGFYNVSLTVTDEFGNEATKFMWNFIEVLDNSCPDTDGDGIDDFDEGTSCTSLLSGSESIGTGDSILVTDFDGEAGPFYISLEVGNNCDITYASGEFSIDIEEDRITPWSYQHFGSDSFIDPLIESDSTREQTSGSDTPAKIMFKLLDDKLYIHHVLNDCDTGTVKLVSGCWSSTDADGDGIPNSLDLDSDNDGLPDITENTPCYEAVAFDETIEGIDSVLLHSFEEGIHFVSLRIHENCTDEEAILEAHVNVDLNEINVIDYRHFGGLENGVSYDLENQVTSNSSTISKLRFKLIEDELYVYQVTTDCGSGITIEPFCWSRLDYDNDGILSYLDVDSDVDGLTDTDESTYCHLETGTSGWFSAGDSTLIVDLADISSTTNEYHVILVSNTNCYGLDATLGAVVDVDDQEIDVASYDHFGGGSDAFIGNGTNEIISSSTSFARVKFSLVGTELYLVQVSNACGSVMRSYPSCITPLDTICEPGHPNYLYSGLFDLSASFCSGETYLFGDLELTEPGVYTETMVSEHGCDSTVTLTLEEYLTYSELIVDEICLGDTLPFGELMLTETGTYVQEFSSILGCDSVVTLELDVHEINTEITVSEMTMSVAEVFGATYLWVDCDDDFSALFPTEDESSFVPETSGNYAVIITDNGCTDTSDCFIIDYSDLAKFNLNRTIKLHPNPTNGIVNIMFEDDLGTINLQIIDLRGRSLFSQKYSNANSIQLDISDFARGEYILIVGEKNRITQFKIIKE